jgi:hypothetical protein
MPPNASRLLPLSQRIHGDPPARNLRDATKLCDPFTPLEPVEDRALREDLTPATGGDRLARVRLTIRRSGDVPTLHFLTGHIGSGKTTELLRLRNDLERTSGDEPMVETFLLDADLLLDRRDVDLEDLLVALWMVLQQSKPSVATAVLAPIWKEQIAGTVKHTLTNLPEQFPAALTAVLGALKLPALDERRKLRVTLGGLANPLITGLNDAFEKVRQDSSSQVAVVIDNLEKLALGDRGAVEHLYLQRMGALRELNCHLIITVPLYLVFSEAGASLNGLYGGATVLLPMVKVAMRGDPQTDAPGVELMANLLSRRVDFELLFESGRDAAKSIARLSGGSTRHALQLVLGALSLHERPKVSDQSVEIAALEMQAMFDRALEGKWIPLLRQIDELGEFPPECDPEVRRSLLRHAFVFEYQNGDPQPWYAVHPLVRRLPRYQRVPKATP